MDIAIPQKKGRHARWYAASILLVLPMLLGVRYLWFLSEADLTIDRDTLLFAEVKRGDFEVTVRGSGVLVPDNTQWISASVDGKVESLAVKAGNVVKQGDLIVELTNPHLIQELAETQWELEAQEAEARASKVARETALLSQKAKVLNAKLNYESSLLAHNAHTELLSTDAVSRLDYERVRLETEQFKQRWLISQKELGKMQENVLAQTNARTARLNKTRKSLERIQEQVDGLYVRSMMDGVVLEMPLEPGQRVTMGDNIARLAEQDSLIAELQVPEIQIRSVAVGQRVIVDTRNNTVEGVVSRIDPAVINGNVQVDVTFTEDLPPDARPDLSVDGEIIITEIADTLYVDRPLFAQSRSHSAFYRVTDDGHFAERVQVEAGFGSVDQIQLIEGLRAGDRIVISDPTRFESHEKFRIN